MSKHRIRFSLILTLILITLTACGKASSQNKNDYQVAVSSASKPLSYTENGKLTGYEVDVLKAVEKELGNVKFNFNAVSQTAELVGLDSKKSMTLQPMVFIVTQNELKKIPRWSRK